MLENFLNVLPLPLPLVTKPNRPERSHLALCRRTAGAVDDFYSEIYYSGYASFVNNSAGSSGGDEDDDRSRVPTRATYDREVAPRFSEPVPT